MSNVRYDSKILSNGYCQNRISWKEFYDSEKVILERVGISKENSILDLGCGCGGLGLSLNEKFGEVTYTGIDINKDSIVKSKSVYSEGTFYCGDILDNNFDNFIEKFDRVISFSSVVWNVEFDSMLKRSWDFVSPGGYLIISLRLTDKETVKNLETSFQQIDDEFKAQYSIVNKDEILKTFEKFNPIEIQSYGYWGDIKKTVSSFSYRTHSPYDKICFCVFAIKKRIDETESTKVNLQLPI